MLAAMKIKSLETSWASPAAEERVLQEATDQQVCLELQTWLTQAGILGKYTAIQVVRGVAYLPDPTSAEVRKLHRILAKIVPGVTEVRFTTLLGCRQI